MNVKFYHTSSPTNKVVKQLSADTAESVYTEVRFTEDETMSILHPVIVLNGISNIQDITKYNYFYIPKFTRYYYISDIKTRGSLVYVSGDCDVLMSWRDDIKASNQYISRQENAPELYNLSKYYVDNMLPISSKKVYAVEPFGSAVDDRQCYHVILETVGKGGTPD